MRRVGSNTNPEHAAFLSSYLPGSSTETERRKRKEPKDPTNPLGTAAGALL